MLLLLPDILSAPELAQAQALLADAPWADGRASAGSQAAQVKNNQQLPHADAAATRARALVLQALDRQPLFFSAVLPKQLFTPGFNRYSEASNHYGAHVDGAVRVAPDSGQRVRTDIACTLFLSQPDSYDGGELHIHAPEQRIKLPAGHLVLYPASSVHAVLPVTRGTRLACFFWIESMVRSSEQRRLLFELDNSIRELRNLHGETAQVVALTGTYHNLLRQWADT